MNKFFYSKLAISNVKKNKKAYVPYMLTCIISIMMFYIMVTITLDPNIKDIMGGGILQMLLSLGYGIVGFFAAIFLFYTNSFLIKNRKKELALYNILGMAKKHLGRMLFLETIYTAIVSLVAGVLAGVVLGKLAFLAVVKLLRTEVPLEYGFSVEAALLSLGVFGVIFLVVLLFNVGRIRLSSPMQLLGGSRHGEKEPKAKWPLLILGIVTTGVGYYLALNVESPIEALVIFALSVVLVIIGTYCLFTSGSIALLKMLRKNKNYYYKTAHFTSVSGMMYRMKRNAAGLASICILSTMVLVTVATTVSLQAGATDVVEVNFPNDFQLRTSKALNSEQRMGLESKVKDSIDKHGLQQTAFISYDYLFVFGGKDDKAFTPKSSMGYENGALQMVFVSLKDSHVAKKYGQLEKDEVIINGLDPYSEKTVKIGDKTYKVKDGDSDFTAVPDSMADAVYVLVSDKSVLDEINEFKLTDDTQPGHYIGVDTADRQGVAAAVKDLTATADGQYEIDDKEEAAQNIYAIYGGLLFIGAFLGLLFLVAAVLIIYYKQISEGYEDNDHYKIMQKVGMSIGEVKQSIKSQILTVFFLPLIAAIIHTAGAFKMMSKLLQTLQLNNIWLFVICTAITILIFIVVYLIVYSITAREYYKIVK